MNPCNDGGPAFARPSSEGVDVTGSHFWPTAQDGMSLRDYFACHALAGILASPSPWSLSPKEQLAEQAYAFADTMLRVRGDGR